jgi:hypothetical protein
MHDAVRVPAAQCPHCGDLQDAASGLEVPTPSPGDMSVCGKCGGVSTYQKDMTRKKWPCNKPLPPEAVKAQRIIRRFRQAN